MSLGIAIRLLGHLIGRWLDVCELSALSFVFIIIYNFKGHIKIILISLVGVAIICEMLMQQLFV